MRALGSNPSVEQRRTVMEVARGARPPDMAVTGGVVANVYSGEWLEANVEIVEGRIAYVGPRTPEASDQTTLIDASGRAVAPGYIEPHCHPWVLYNPVSLLEAALPDGTTTIVMDTLFFFLYAGTQGLRRILDELADVPAHLFWNARIISQSRYPGEREDFSVANVAEQLSWPDVALSGEITRWSALYEGDEHIVGGLHAAKAAGKRSDGHTAGASYQRLVPQVAAGLSADHEAITAAEALERLRLGLWTMLRHSSLRPDGPALMRGLLEAGVHTSRLMLTTDGAAPLRYRERGMMTDALETAVEQGLDPMQALQMCTINPATFLGLDEELGGIAPGRSADLLLLPSPGSFRPETVVVKGRIVAEDGALTTALPRVDWKDLGLAADFTSGDRLDGACRAALASSGEATVPAMMYESAVINRGRAVTLGTRDGLLDLSEDPDLIFGLLCDRKGRWITRAVIGGLMPELQGLATTFNTSTDLLVLGRDPDSMCAAVREVAERGGGIAFAERGAVSWSVALPIGGMMSEGSFDDAAAIETELTLHSAAAGYPYHDILYTLLFSVCDFLPELRLTAEGVLDVKSRRIVDPALRL